jgi:hypothetical protein
VSCPHNRIALGEKRWCVVYGFEVRVASDCVCLECGSDGEALLVPADRDTGWEPDEKGGTTFTRVAP